jgi:hypothetical protein
MADTLGFYSQLCRDRGLFDAQLLPALPEEFRHTSIVLFVHGIHWF